MPAPSYPHRHLLLTSLLDSLPIQCPPDAFAVPGETNERGCKLDALLLEGWTGTGSKPSSLPKDVIQHAESLRLKKGDFDILGRIGEGQFGVVDAVRCKFNGRVYAMKSIEKSMVMRAGSHLSLGVERHIHNLAKDTSPVPSFAAAFQSPTALHLVSSFAPCGSLWDRMCEMLPVPGLDTGRMEENEVSWWARQMVDAIAWLHGQGYVHRWAVLFEMVLTIRDIKPHNFLLLPDCRLWLTDFGSAAPLCDGVVPRRLCLVPTGTPDYVAPEVLRVAEDALVAAAHSDADESNHSSFRASAADIGGYGREVDWWSLGATLYEMSVGRAPFFAPSISATYQRIMCCDVRMPNELSPQLKSLLSGLLSSIDVRLGSGDVNQIRRHSFFCGIDWSKLGDSPTGLVCPPLDLDTLADSFIHFAGDDITFDHFFESTVAGLTTSISSSGAVSMAVPTTWGRWVGWSLDPPTDTFGTEPPAITISPPTLKPLIGYIRQHSAPPGTHLFTPMRPGVLNEATPPTVPRTAPRSVPRTRPVSERQAFAELIKCVQASARKKLASTVVKIPGSAETTSSMASSGWRADHPPTPTPVSRDVTVLTTRNAERPSSRISLRASQEELPVRPLERTSPRARDERSQRPDDLSPRFPPRPLSRATSLRDTLPVRSLARTSSLPLWEESSFGQRPPSHMSLHSGSSSGSKFAQRMSALRTASDGSGASSWRSISGDGSATVRNGSSRNAASQDSKLSRDSSMDPLSLTSARGSDRIPSLSSKDQSGTFLAKLVGVENVTSGEIQRLPSPRGTLANDYRHQPWSSPELVHYTGSSDATPPTSLTIPFRPPCPPQFPTTHGLNRPLDFQQRLLPFDPQRTHSELTPTHAMSLDLASKPSAERYASMKVWHNSLEDGFADLERRLADLMSRLGHEL